MLDALTQPQVLPFLNLSGSASLRETSAIQSREELFTPRRQGANEEAFPPRLQGRPALHRLRPKDRGHAERRGHAMSAGEREPRMNANRSEERRVGKE